MRNLVDNPVASSPSASSAGRPRASGRSRSPRCSTLRCSAPRPTRGAARTRGLPRRAKRVIWLTMAGGPSQLETFDPKPELSRMDGKPMPESFTTGPAARPAPGAEARLPWPHVPLPQVRQERDRDLRTVPAHRVGDRRDLPHPLDDHRGDQPRPGPHVHEHRFADRRPAQHGRLGHLRPGQRGRRPARLRRAHVDRQGAVAPADRRAAVEQRVPAQPLSGRPDAEPGRGRPLPGQPAGRLARSSRGPTSPPSTPSTRSTTRWCTTRRSPRASPSTRWPSGCRPASPS